MDIIIRPPYRYWTARDLIGGWYSPASQDGKDGYQPATSGSSH